jgi:hypothetical protein
MQLLIYGLKRIIPLSFVAGASMEFFMIKTGFYEIVTEKEAERLADKLLEEARLQRRTSEFKIKIDKDNE